MAFDRSIARVVLDLRGVRLSFSALVDGYTTAAKKGDGIVPDHGFTSKLGAVLKWLADEKYVTESVDASTDTIVFSATTKDASGIEGTVRNFGSGS